MEANNWLIGQARELEIKRKIINILNTFRSLGILGDSDVKINSLEKEPITLR